MFYYFVEDNFKGIIFWKYVHTIVLLSLLCSRNCTFIFARPDPKRILIL